MKSRAHAVTALVALTYVLLTVTYIFRLPLDAGPDEGRHVEYMEILRAHRRLPVLQGHARPGEESLECQQAQHPPLYYLVLTLLSAPLSDLRSETAWRLLRLLSFAQGAIALLLLFKCAHLLWPDDPIASAAVAIVALFPQYQYMTAVINNSTGALLCTTVVLYAIVLTMKAGGRNDRAWYLLGAAVAAALLTKLTTAWVIVVAVVCVVMCTRQQSQRKIAYLGKHLLMTFGPVTALLGLWIARSWHLFGMLIPQSVTERPWPGTSLFACLMLPDAFWVTFIMPIPHILATLPVPFWLTIPLDWSRWWIVGPLLGLASVAAAGFVRTWLRRHGGWTDRQAWHTSLAGLCVVGIIVSYCLTIVIAIEDVNVLTCGGRYMLSVLPAGALAWAIGLHRLTDSARARSMILGLILVGLLVASIWMHAWVVAFHNI